MTGNVVPLIVFASLACFSCKTPGTSSLESNVTSQNTLANCVKLHAAFEDPREPDQSIVVSLEKHSQMEKPVFNLEGIGPVTTTDFFAGRNDPMPEPRPDSRTAKFEGMFKTTSVRHMETGDSTKRVLFSGSGVMNFSGYPKYTSFPPRNITGLMFDNADFYDGMWVYLYFDGVEPSKSQPLNSWGVNGCKDVNKSGMKSLIAN